MGRLKNPESHIGERYGKLTIVGYIPEDEGPTHFRCVCDCSPDKPLIVEWTDLKNKRKQSCGCWQKEQGKFRALDLMNQVFGDFKALEKTDFRKSGKVVWRCKCLRCGHEELLSTRQLKAVPDRHCPVCHELSHNSKGEEKICELLKWQNLLFETEKSFEGCKSKKNIRLRFDFFVEGSWLIEFDGIQHFERTAWSKDLEYIKEKDEVKNEFCRKNGYPLIRIPYWEYDNMTLLDLLPNTSKFLVVKGGKSVGKA